MEASPRRAAGPMPEPEGPDSWDIDFFEELSTPTRTYAIEPVEFTAPLPWEALADDDHASLPWSDWSDEPPELAEATEPTGDEDWVEPTPRRAFVDDAPEPVDTVADIDIVEEPQPVNELDIRTTEYPIAGAPRRAAGFVKADRRKRVRVATLVAGIALLAAGGGAVVPGLIDNSRTTSAVPAAAATRGDNAGTGDSAEPLRANERPSRSDRVDPAEEADGPTAEQASQAPPIALKMADPKLAGVPNPCLIDMPITADMSAAEITSRAEKQWGFKLTGSQWRDDAYRPVVELFAETLDAVDCTGYLDRVKAGNGGSLEISSNPTRSWAWGDYGLTRANVLTLDFVKFRQGYADGDRGRLVRLVIHEMAHSLNADRGSDPAYWRAFNRVWGTNGPVSAYGSTPTESFADAVGYYVARCAADNPYATTKHSAYYDYVKKNIFDGREFGGAVGTPQYCDVKGR